MKKEIRSLIYSMIDNLIISSFKIISGIFFKTDSLIADGMHTFSDFITDVVAIFGTKISKKRPNKLHPFGFGRVEYITGLFIGVFVFLLGVFILLKAFNPTFEIPSLIILVVVVTSLLLKSISVTYLYKMANKIKSQILMVSAKESLTDMYSSVIVAISVILMQFSGKISILKYSDMVGSIILGLLIFVTAFKMVKENTLALLGEVDLNNEKIEKIKEVLDEIDGIDLKSVKLIKYGSYYKAQILLSIEKNISMKKFLYYRKIIESKIKNKKIGVKYVTIDIELDDEKSDK